MNPGDTVQIEAPDFDPDIDRVTLPSADKKPNDFTTQGTSSPTPAITEPEGDSPTPVTTIQHFTSQEMDWLNASQFISHRSRLQHSSLKSRKLQEVKLDITPKVSKFWIWRTIQKKSSSLI